MSNQIKFLQDKLSKGEFKNKYPIINKLKKLKKQQIKKQIDSFSESYEDFLAR